jgi:hypothetical protein
MSVLHKEELPVDDERKEAAGWGMHVNTNVYRGKPPSCPAWAKPMQREDWKSRGLIVWKDETHTITRLSAQDALQVLASLQANDAWKQDGLVVGRPMTRFSLSQPDAKPEEILVDTIALNADEVMQLFGFLQLKRGVLQTMAEADEEERKRRLAAAFRILLNAIVTKQMAEERDEASRPVVPDGEV